MAIDDGGSPILGVDQRVPPPVPLTLAFVLVGVGTTSIYSQHRVGGLSIILVIAFGLAALGFVSSHGEPIFKAYATTAFPLAIWALVSGVASWNGDALYGSVGFAAWLVAVFGLAALLRSATLRSALVIGFGLGATEFGVRLLIRIISTGSALDPNSELIFGRQRNTVTPVLLLLVAFVFVPTSRRWGWARAPITVTLLIELINIRARASLGGALIAIAIILLTDSGVQKRMKIVYGTLVIVLLALLVPSALGVVHPTIERFRDLTNNDTDASEEVRRLLLKKSLQLTAANPVFGVGYENSVGLSAPAADEATSTRTRDRVVSSISHNTFADAFVSFGVPGGILFVALIITPLRRGLRRNIRALARAPTAAFAGLVVWCLFQSNLGMNMLYLAMALALGATAEAEASLFDERQRWIVPPLVDDMRK